VQRRTIAALVVAAIALVVLVGAAKLFVFGPGEECGLGMSQVHIVHDTGETVARPADARLAIHGAYGVDANETDRRFTIRDIGPNQSEFNRSYAHAAPKDEDVKEGVPARSDRIDEDEAFYIFRGDGENSVGATEEGDVFVLTRGAC
jgi:hypothetical protein